MLESLCVNLHLSIHFPALCSLCSSDESWRVFLKRFATSVQHITGQEIEVKSPGESDSRDIIEQELEALRLRVDELSDEVHSFSVFHKNV